MNETKMTDTIIIGCGPAGISAAIYVLRAGFSVKMFSKDMGALEKAEKIDNYFGFEEPINGQKLILNGRKQAVRLGACIFDEEVTGISWSKNGFSVSSSSGKSYSKSVIFATGTQRKRIDIENLNKFEGSGVSYCAVCDAFFYKGKHVGILGNGEYALNEVGELIRIAERVSLITNGAEIKAEFPETVEIYSSPVDELFGKERLNGVCFSDGTKLELDGLFIAYGTADAGALARELGLALKDGKIAVDENMKTVLPGLFAAGDCTGGIAQVSVAVGEGARAGFSAIEFLRKNR